MRVSQKIIFLSTFGITLLARAMTWHEINVIPYTFIYILFIGSWGIVALLDSGFKFKISKDPIPKVIVLLFIYFLVFGLSNISNLDFTDTMNYTLRSFMMMSFVLVSCYWIKRYDCIYETIKISYILLAALMIFSFLTNITKINLIQTLATFWISEEWLRTRVMFGFIANNIAAEYSMTVILLSILMIWFDKDLSKNMTIKRLAFYLIDLIMVLIIIANNSRGTMISLFVIGFIYFLLKSIKNNSVRKSIQLLVFGAIVVVLSALWYASSNGLTLLELLKNTNRYHFFNNIEALNNSGRWLMGLGNISGQYFAKGNYLYGTNLNYMEMYYVGIYVKSGVIGMIFMVSIILTILQNIYKYSLVNNVYLGKWALIVFSYMLFLSLFEDYLFSYTYVTSTIFMIFIFSIIQNNYNHKPNIDL